MDTIQDVFMKKAASQLQDQQKNSRENSIENQVLFKGWIDLVVADKVDAMPSDIIEDVMSWAREVVGIPQNRSNLSKKGIVDTPTQMNTIGDLFTASKNLFNLTPTQVLNELGLNSKEALASR